MVLDLQQDFISSKNYKMLNGIELFIEIKSRPAYRCKKFLKTNHRFCYLILHMLLNKYLSFFCMIRRQIDIEFKICFLKYERTVD